MESSGEPTERTSEELQEQLRSREFMLSLFESGLKEAREQLEELENNTEDEREGVNQLRLQLGLEPLPIPIDDELLDLSQKLPDSYKKLHGLDRRLGRTIEVTEQELEKMRALKARVGKAKHELIARQRSGIEESKDSLSEDSASAPVQGSSEEELSVDIPKNLEDEVGRPE